MKKVITLSINQKLQYLQNYNITVLSVDIYHLIL